MGDGARRPEKAGQASSSLTSLTKNTSEKNRSYDRSNSSRRKRKGNRIGGSVPSASATLKTARSGADVLPVPFNMLMARLHNDSTTPYVPHLHIRGNGMSHFAVHLCHVVFSAVLFRVTLC